MSPSLYSRIYKGALGEVVGKQIFKDSLNIELEDIEDSSVYEFFDYKVPNKPIYVDFKKWKEVDLGQEQTEKLRSEIFAKAKKCGAETILIINIISKTKRQCKPPITKDNCSLLEIPQLYFEDEGQVKLSLDSINKIYEVLDKEEALEDEDVMKVVESETPEEVREAYMQEMEDNYSNFMDQLQMDAES